MVHEYAKQKIYEDNYKALEFQFHIGAQQLYNQKIVADKVDVVVTDSPFVLSNIYNTTSPHLNAGFVQEFNKFRNMNYLLIRNTESYTENGRIHNYEQAVELDKKVKVFLDENEIAYKMILADKNASVIVLEDIQRALTTL